MPTFELPGHKKGITAPTIIYVVYKGTGERENEMFKNKTEKKWYQKNIWIIVLLILFFPLGLFLMWKYANWKKFIKIIVSVFFALCVVGAILPSSLEEIALSANTTNKYDINTDIEIKFTVTPSTYSLPDNAFKTSGGTLQVFDDYLLFSSDKPGNFDVYAEYDNIKSNILTFTIEDKAAIEAQRKAEEEKKKAEEEARIKAEQEEAARIAAEKKAAEEKAAAEQAAAEQAQAEANTQSTENNQQNIGGIVYWTPNGEVYHSTPDCPSLGRSKTIYSGSIAESGKSRPCKNCY